MLFNFDYSPFLRSSERDGEQLRGGSRGGGRGQREPQVRGGRQPRGRDYLEEGGGEAGAGQLPRPRHRRGQQVRSAECHMSPTNNTDTELTPGPTPAPPPMSSASRRQHLSTWRLTVSI